MMRLRRQNKVKSQQAISLIKSKRVKVDNNTAFKLADSSSRNDLTPSMLFHQCMQRMVPHVWHKIIPSSLSDIENMAFAFGQSWERIQKLLMHSKKLKSIEIHSE